MECFMEEHYITTPEGAYSVFGKPPNGKLFPNRQSYLLSSPGVTGDLPWLLVHSREGHGAVGMRDDNNVLREEGTYQHGQNTVTLKAGVRDISLSVTISGEKKRDKQRLEYCLACEYIASILSPDLATVFYPESPEVIPYQFGTPLPWTYSWKRLDGQFRHIDFAAGWLDTISDEAPSPHLTRTRLMMTCDEPWFYGDEITIPFSSATNIPLLGEDLLFRGSVRTPFVLKYQLPSLLSGKIRSITMVDNTREVVRVAKYLHANWGIGGGWPAQGGEYTFDTKEKVFHRNGIPLDGSAAGDAVRSWTQFRLLPISKSNLIIEADFDIPIEGTVSYRPLYAGI